MAAICCHEPVFFSSEAPLGTHQGVILPRPAARERIGAISCHVRQPENASGRYLAIAMRRMIATEVHRWLIWDCEGWVALVLPFSDLDSNCAIRWEKRLSIV